MQSQIQIDAPPSIVWSVTTDIERWPEWTPTVESVRRLDDGPFDVGSAALIKQPGLPEATWRVTSLVKEERFTWETSVRGMRMVATHELSPAGEGTQNTLRIEFSGVAAILLWPLVRSSVRKSLEQENAGLKEACEAAASV